MYHKEPLLDQSVYNDHAAFARYREILLFPTIHICTKILNRLKLNINTSEEIGPEYIKQ